MTALAPLLLTLVVAAPPVLGAEAAPILLRWAKRLEGLEVSSVPIARDRARVELGATCALILTHEGAATCPLPVELGTTTGCWEGTGCPREVVRTKALTAAGALALPWKVPPGDQAGDAARQILIAARRVAQERLDVMDPEGAREALLPLLSHADLEPADLVSVLPVLARVGGGAEAWRALDTELAPALVPGLDILLRVALLAGPDAAAAVAPIVLANGGGKQACGAAAVASAYVMTQAFGSAGSLARSLRTLDPRCLDAWAAEIEAFSQLARGAEVEAAFQGARAALGDDPRLMELENVVLEARGDVRALVERLEADVAGGDRSPGLFKKLLGFYVRQELRSEKMEHWVAEAEAKPKDAVAAFFAGVLLHYERAWERSNALLARAESELPAEPRLHIYRAMNLYNLGSFEASAASITRAESLEVQDPDVFYCQGEIFRDSDPGRAQRALEVYWHQTRHSSDPSSSKQKRVRGLIEALGRCIEEPPEGPCPGPWEHYPPGQKRPDPEGAR